MGVLGSLLGNLTARVIRLAIVAVVLVCAYLLIAKPALHKAGGALHPHGIDPQHLLHCVKHAHQDVSKLERCARRF